MTPPALTPAARTTRRKAPAGPKPSARPAGSKTSARPAGSKTAARSAAAPRPATKSRSHRSQLHPGIAPRTTRRVSGPLTGLTRGRATTTRQPPAAPRSRTPRPAAAPAGASLAARAAAYVRALPDHSLLDRIIRGRVWIPLLGVLLAGIVAMQVEVLKLNAGTGVSLQRTTALQNQRDVLEASVAQLADDQRIESRAAQMGLVMPAPSQVKFLTAGPGDTGAAVGNVHQPNQTAFAAQLPGAVTTGGVSSPSGTVPTAAVPGATVAPALGTGTTAATGTPATTATATTATVTTAPTTTTAAPVTSSPATVAPTTQVAAPTTSSPGAAATGGVSATPAGG
jgi:hypothetical protein